MKIHHPETMMLGCEYYYVSGNALQTVFPHSFHSINRSSSLIKQIEQSIEVLLPVIDTLSLDASLRRMADRLIPEKNSTKSELNTI